MMIVKKNLIIAVLATFCVTFALFSVIPTRSLVTKEYDPMADLTGPDGVPDGTINMRDIGYVCSLFGTSGTPINWSQLLLLQSRVDSLNESVIDLQTKIESLERQMPKKGYISVSPASFVPERAGTAVADYVRSIAYFSGTNYNGQGFYAQVQLPHGAMITNFTAFVYFGSSYDLHVMLYRNNFNDTYDRMAYICSGGSGFVTLNDDSIDYAAIDNTLHSYLVYVIFTNPTISADLRLYRVVIEYEYP